MVVDTELKTMLEQWAAEANIDQPVLDSLLPRVASVVEEAARAERESIFKLLCPFCAEGDIPHRIEGRSASSFPWVHELKEPIEGRTLEQCKAARLREWAGLPSYSARQLAALISALSKRAYHQQIWMSDVEFNLWTVVSALGKPNLPGLQRYYGYDNITQDELATLKRLSEEAGGWVYWDVYSHMFKFAPLGEWVRIHERQYDRYNAELYDEITRVGAEESNEALPSDAAEQHDHYLYGAEKRS